MSLSLRLTLGIYGLVVSMTEDFSVLVQLVPSVTYFSGTGMYIGFCCNVINKLPPPKNWVKGVAISAVLLISLLSVGWAVSASVEASALLTQDKNHKALQMVVDANV